MDGLTIVVAGIVSLLSLVVGYLLRKYFGEAKIASAEQEANKILEDATRQAESIKKEARVEVKDDLHKLRTETENELKERRQEVLPVSYTHLRAHETDSYLVCRLLLEKKKRHTAVSRGRHKVGGK